MTGPKYRQIHNYLKEKIQKGLYSEGDILPSENELCSSFSITRTTVRKALEELIKEGFIEKKHGKGSFVKERRQSLGLLNVKGFSEAVGQNVKTVFLKKPAIREWSNQIQIPVSLMEKQKACIHFERLRFVKGEPVMLENNWLPDIKLGGLISNEFVEASFFKTLSRNYRIEIIGSESELRAENAGSKIAELLKIKEGYPVLHISLKFKTSNPVLNIYSELYCNTQKYPIGNIYHL
ncbi:MAG: GntR family transcriptional regulator [Prolixibacteraceae bacterium]|nr:GntR family transcriptional regulator [Prolixibacteraceae bacterium]MBN2773118.1 GntR family transcriptional regulator [Prolixibacteraceae bacterium]